VSTIALDDAIARRLYHRARADRWGLSVERFAALLQLVAERLFGEEPTERRRLERYLESLHLDDLALACACAEGIDSAWDHFVHAYRPVLYRAADAIDPSGGARELADSLYGELFGLGTRDGQRQSLFGYFHGRISLATWLRAVLSQRYVDRVRRDVRSAPLPDDEEPGAVAAEPASQHAGLLRYIDVMRRVTTATIAALPARDRLRLRCYYAQDLTLAQIGKALGEHEATVSRNLARTRRTIRAQAEFALRHREGLPEAEIAECFAAVLEDPGTLDIGEMLGRKEVTHGRSKNMERRTPNAERRTEDI
jgi:RNA polymerase sigma-70 factor (ECF subfamily)